MQPNDRKAIAELTELARILSGMEQIRKDKKRSELENRVCNPQNAGTGGREVMWMGTQTMRILKRISPKSALSVFLVFMYSPYNRFRASLITFSTGAAGSSFSMAATTFCDAACANPSMVSAATASS